MLRYTQHTLDAEDEAAVLRVLRSAHLTQGPEVEAFEQAMAAYTGARYAVAVSSGTAALHLAVLALELPSGSSGITSANTFVATANALIYAGLTPRLVDIDPQTYTLAPTALQTAIAAQAAGVILPVHFAGQPAYMAELAAIARSVGAAIIEDAAHALGARYAAGQRVGSCAYADMTVFSLHPAKNMTSAEGGIITTNDAALYQRLQRLRTHGIEKDPAQCADYPGPWHYEMQTLGFNYRLSDLHAALGRSQLNKLDRFVARRRELVARYNAAFAELPWLTTPYEVPDVYSAWHLYIVQIDWAMVGVDRKAAMKRLRQAGIGTQVLYIPVHWHPYYRAQYGEARDDCPQAEMYYNYALALPLHPGLSEAEQAHVCDQVKALADRRGIEV